jgi:hypothetical protein
LADVVDHHANDVDRPHSLLADALPGPRSLSAFVRAARRPCSVLRATRYHSSVHYGYVVKGA